MRKFLPENEVVRLVTIFLLWKTFLVAVALTSPGPGYDTSTELLGFGVHSLTSKLTRWDAIYFTTIARHDYRFEQEWAFGWGFTRFLKLLTKNESGSNTLPQAEAWVGIGVSHLAHLVSVLALYDSTKRLFEYLPYSKNLPYTASVLHVVSPAGLFLSAPYTEGFFSCLSFVGYDFFIRAAFSKSDAVKDLQQLSSALLFGLSATVRSNGLLNGILFVSEALYGLLDVLKHGIGAQNLRRLFIVGLSGCIVGIGNIVPQYLAYSEFCSVESAKSRSWCKAMPPSIYNFVQVHYWNNGLFRYWTLPNLPLFVFAAPGIALLTKSSHWVCRSWNASAKQQNVSPEAVKAQRTLRAVALSQLALVLLIVTSSHIQIITRLASGYPVWYWWIAYELSMPNTQKKYKIAEVTITWMVLYAGLQGALFAGFLPPA